MTTAGVAEIADIDAASSLFLSLTPDETGETFHSNIPPHLCVGRPDRPFLFGGAAFAAALEAMHRVTEKPVIYAAAQFGTFGRPDQKLRFQVHRIADGTNISQTQVTGFADDRPFLSVQAALGTRESSVALQSIIMDDVPTFEQCQPIPTARILSARLENMFEIRPARGRFAWDGPWTGEAEGSVSFWARARNGAPCDYRMLTELADLIAIGLPSAIGRDSSANSLDNHMRFGQIRPTEWTLCQIHIATVADGLVHGTVHLFHPDGGLMAIASQSMLLRLWKASR